MAVNLTDMDIGTRYALQEDFNNGFVGRDRQVVIQTDDPKGYRPVIMDGATTGGKNKVALVDDLSDYVPVDTYNSEKAGFATKGELSSYATKTELSSYETTSHASATYATKSELTSGLAGKADSSALASYATKSELTSGLATKQPVGDYRTKSELDSIYLGINAKAKSAETADSVSSIDGNAILGKVGCTGAAPISVTSLPFTAPNDGYLYGDFVVSIPGTASATAKLLVDESVYFQKSITPENNHTYRNEFSFFVSKGQVVKGEFKNAYYTGSTRLESTLTPISLYAISEE